MSLFLPSSDHFVFSSQMFSSRSCATILHDDNLPWPDVVQADDRRLAELHYKMCLTLQYLDQPEDSLKEIKVWALLGPDTECA